MTDTTAVPERPTYGNWIKHRSPGLLGAGMVGTTVLFAGILLALLTMLVAGVWPALYVAGAALVAFTVTGTPLGSWVTRRALYVYASLQGETTHRSGVLVRSPRRAAPEAAAPVAPTRLPGKLGTSELLEAADSWASFGVVKSAGGLYTIVARCSAEGPWMQDQDRIDAWVANYSAVLSACGQETGLVCAKAITDTAPDPGGRLVAMVDAIRSDDSPALARRVMAETVADLPASSSDNLTYLELTFKGRQINRKGDQAAILAELARKAPGLVAMMQAAGGGAVDMLTGAELARLVRVAYDPVVAPALERAELEDVPDGIEWKDAGPVAYRDLWAELVHDSGRSITWEMAHAPRSKITEGALAGLLAPHTDFARKRVALLYRPHTPDESTRVAERDANTANFVAQQGKKRPSASAKLVQRAAEQSRQEVAAGAASVRFSLLVTVTVLADGDVAQAVSTVESRARAVPMRLRRCYGAQAAAFAATLPVGFVPWEHTAVSSSVREWL